MKLRYYLRGLGIGILVTVLILGIAGGKSQSMSDEQIRARAAELGMVDVYSRVLGNLQSDLSSESDGTQSSSGISQSSPEEQAEEQTEEQTEPQAEETSESDEPQSVENSVSFTIRSGAGSDSISLSLEQAGLVESAGEFDTYLNENGYSRRLRAGTFSIPVGSSIEEIARIITGG